MKEKRYYFDGTISENSSIWLQGDEFHHLTNVMRTRVGERVCIFNGDSNFYFGEVITINKKDAEIHIDTKVASENEPQINLTVFQALAKGDKLSLITQKITELGATNLCLFESDFCDVKANTHKPDRLETISISAAKQCGRASVLNIHGVLKIKEVANLINDFDAFYVAYENEDGHTLVSSISNLKNPSKVAVMIGAEGGFSTKEIEILKESGADIVSLGRRILRTETASIACASVIMQLLDK